MPVIVGIIAVALGPVVWFLAEESLSSISIAYWTDARDVFVGSLIAVGFFLAAYNGSGESRDLEFFLSKFSCVLAICVALFPTDGFNNHNSPPVWTASLTGGVGLRPLHVHIGSAVSLFICLFVMMWFFSLRAMEKGKQGRSIIYRVIAVLMLGGMAVIGAIGYAIAWANAVFYVEWWGLSLFGIGWFIAGCYKTESPTDHDATSNVGVNTEAT